MLQIQNEGGDNGGRKVALELHPSLNHFGACSAVEVGGGATVTNLLSWV